MSEFEIECKLIPDVQTALKKYFKKKNEIIGSKLKIKLKESMEYLRTMIADFAPEGSSVPHLKDIINSLPISAISGNASHFDIEKNGKMSIVIVMNRKKDEKIRWVNNGTGIYGPFNCPIISNKMPPRPMKFEIGGETIIVWKVRGQKGQKFIQKAVSQSKLIISTKIRSAFK